MIHSAPPKPDELVEELFSQVLIPPDGYEYYYNDNQLLFPIFEQDKWRLLLHKTDTDMFLKENFHPVFLEGEFIRKMAKALHAMQRDLNQAVSAEFPEPTSKSVQ